MKHIFKLIVVASSLGLLASCDEDHSTPPTKPADNAANLSAAWEEKLAQERQLRLTAEARLRESEASVSGWQTLAVLAVAGGITALFAGAMLGSRARKDASHEGRK